MQKIILKYNLMKCPDCGHEWDGAKCIHCEKKLQTPQHEIEVEYKEFKISELLEIRKKHRKKSLPKGHREKIKADLRGRNTLNDTSLSGVNKIPAGLSRGRKKRLLITMFAFLLITATITGAFYFLRLFLQH
ncbi:MAG: hypothetical protein AB1390_00230 [Nitrospirota bacterium]